MDASAESPAAGQTVLHVLRAGCHPRAASRPEGLDRQVQRQVRPRLGQTARDHIQSAKEAGRDRRRRRADVAARGNSGLGRDGSQAQAGARARDGSLRGVHGAHRPPCRPTARRAQGPRGARRYADLLDHRRQRRLRRGHAARRVQRDGELQRHGRPRDARVHDVEARRVRRRGIVRPLCRGLGLGDGFPLSVDEAGRVALGRHAQRHRSCTGRTASRKKAACAISSAT